jgi:hypothetical protein
MDNELKTLIELAKRLPEGKLDEAIERINEIKQENDEKGQRAVPKCRIATTPISVRRRFPAQG